ncbi:MAG: preprotein translocase subunit YajC [Bacteroidia bacterium]|nr:preprotein translocase subunit YajC [Bacteroidia bacterium]
MSPQQEGGEGSGWMSFLPLILIVVVFYFFFIRPQMKKSKDQKQFRASIQKGQKVLTIGGIHGRIVEMQETTVTLEVENGVRFRIEKSAIASSTSDTIESK